MKVTCLSLLVLRSSELSQPLMCVAGEEVGFYFTWMKFYSSFVFWPAVLGILMFLFRPSNATVDTDAYLPFYSVFMALWGVLFLVVSALNQQLAQQTVLYICM